MEELKNSLTRQLYFYRQVLFTFKEPILQIIRLITIYIYIFIFNYRESIDGQHPQKIPLMEEKT